MSSPEPQWRMVDARAFVHDGALKLVKVDDLTHQNYVAISYTWSQGMKNWRQRMVSNATESDSESSLDYETKMAIGSLQISTSNAAVENIQNLGDFVTLEDRSVLRAHLFFATVALIVLTRGKPYFWMDIVCIDQDNMSEKEYFVSRMGNLYGNASETHAYPTGSSIAPSVASEEFYFPVWETRAWTVQEFILAKSVLFCYMLEGDAVEDLKGIQGGGGESADSQGQTITLNSTMIKQYRYNQIGHGYSLVFDWTGMGVTCFIEAQSVYGGNLPLDAFMEHEITQKGNWGSLEKAVSRGTFGRTLFQLKNSDVSREVLMRTSLVYLGGRRSTVPEDMVYCLLGILGLQNYPVRYGVGFEEARLGIFEALEPDTLKYLLATDWGCNPSSERKDSALPRIVGSASATGIDIINATSSPKFTKGIGTRVFSRLERFRLWKDLSRIQSRSQAVTQTEMGNTRVMYCTSLLDNPAFVDIPPSDIPEDQIHVVLIGGDRMSVDEYFSEEFTYDRVVDLVEIGICSHHAMFPDDERLVRRTALLTLQLEETTSGHFVNKGTALVLDASALSGQYSSILIE